MLTRKPSRLTDDAQMRLQRHLDDHWDEICASIRSSDYFVCVASPRYEESAYCRLELEYALALGRTVLPITINEHYDLAPRLPEISATQSILFTLTDPEGAVRLVNAINACTNTPFSTAATSARSISPRSKRKMTISTLFFAFAMPLISLSMPSPGCTNNFNVRMSFRWNLDAKSWTDGVP